MSVSSISTKAASAFQRPSLQQILAAKLARLDNDTTTQSTPDAGSGASTASGQGGSNTGGVTGSSTTQLSDGILSVLFAIQQDSAATADAAAQSQSSAQSQDASLQNFLSAMDTDGDSDVSQSEFETYLTKNGATKEQADKIFSAVDGDASGGISSSELSQAIENGRPPHGPGGHGPHAPPPLEDIANRLLQSLDADGDGSVSQTDLESFVTAKGGTNEQADQDFAGLDINGDGAVTQDELTQKLVDLLPRREDKPARKETAGTSSAESTQTSSSVTPGTTSTTAASDTQSAAWLRMLDALASASALSKSTTTASTVAMAA